MKISKQTQLNDHLLDHDFSFIQDFEQSFRIAKIVAEQYARNENAIAVLSNMVSNTSYICYGRLGAKLGLDSENEEIPSIWEKKILDRIHPDDVAEKIAWELQFFAFVKQQPMGERKDYYLQHFLRFKDTQGAYHVLRNRIFYLDMMPAEM